MSATNRKRGKYVTIIPFILLSLSLMIIVPFHGSHVTTWNLQRERDRIKPNRRKITKKIHVVFKMIRHAYVQAVEDTLTSRLFRQDLMFVKCLYPTKPPHDFVISQSYIIYKQRRSFLLLCLILV